MRILAVENYRDTPLGLVGEALAEAGAAIDLRRPFLGEALPADDLAYDGLVILGGGQNARDDVGSPWLPHLVELTRAFAAADKSVLGICLGSQLIARAFGAENRLGMPMEFGWHEVVPTEAGRRDPLISALGDGAPLFHWHEDTFSLPPGAQWLAKSEATPHQAFRLGRAVYGLQFHFEADTCLVRDWNDQFADEIVGIDPNWAQKHAAEAGPLGEKADRVGRAIARAFVDTVALPIVKQRATG